jgi:hypothetical protein
MKKRGNTRFAFLAFSNWLGDMVQPMHPDHFPKKPRISIENLDLGVV